MENKTLPHETNKVEQNVNGELTYEDKVIQKIIGIALKDIPGLLTVDGGFFSNIAEKLVNTDNVTSGISTEVGKKQVAVDLNVVVEYGRDVRDIYDQIKRVIKTEVDKMTHLDVIEINVNVVDIKTREEYEKESETVQDKVTDAAGTAGSYISTQAGKAKKSIDRGTENVKENLEPRVE